MDLPLSYIHNPPTIIPVTLNVIASGIYLAYSTHSYDLGEMTQRQQWSYNI